MIRCIHDGYVILLSFFFFNDTATTEIYTLSLHDALPICAWSASRLPECSASGLGFSGARRGRSSRPGRLRPGSASCCRSEEHTSELQSHVNLVCRLLLEKKKN